MTKVLGRDEVPFYLGGFMGPDKIIFMEKIIASTVCQRDL